MKDANLVALKVRDASARINNTGGEILTRHTTIQKISIHLKGERERIRGKVSPPQVMFN
jgi:hypothetical protein